MQIIPLESYPFHVFLVEALVVAVADQHRQHILTLTMQDGINNIMTGDILDLATAEVVLRCQGVESLVTI